MAVVVSSAFKNSLKCSRSNILRKMGFCRLHFRRAFAMSCSLTFLVCCFSHMLFFSLLSSCHALRLKPPYTQGRGPEALWARKTQKVSKRSSWAPVCEKVSKKSRMTRKRIKKTIKSVLGDFFDTLLTLQAGRPKKSFLRLFGDFGARGCGGSCTWGIVIVSHESILPFPSPFLPSYPIIKLASLRAYVFLPKMACHLRRDIAHCGQHCHTTMLELCGPPSLESCLSLLQRSWGGDNGAFGKWCSCVGDTCHSRHFRQFQG